MFYYLTGKGPLYHTTNK